MNSKTARDTNQNTYTESFQTNQYDFGLNTLDADAMRTQDLAAAKLKVLGESGSSDGDGDSVNVRSIRDKNKHKQSREIFPNDLIENQEFKEGMGTIQDLLNRPAIEIEIEDADSKSSTQND